MDVRRGRSVPPIPVFHPFNLWPPSALLKARPHYFQAARRARERPIRSLRRRDVAQQRQVLVHRAQTATRAASAVRLAAGAGNGIGVAFQVPRQQVPQQVALDRRDRIAEVGRPIIAAGGIGGDLQSLGLASRLIGLALAGDEQTGNAELGLSVSLLSF